MRYRIYAAAMALVLTGLVVLFAGKQPVEVDLLALLPDIAQGPAADIAEQRLANVLSERMIFLIGNRNGIFAKQSAEVFAKSLGESKAFKSVQARIDVPDPDLLVGFYAGYQQGLLVPDDVRVLMSGGEALTARLLSRLTSPFMQGMVPVARDPFGFFDNWLAQLPYRNSRLQLSDGWLLVRHDDVTWVLVTTVLAGSPYNPSVEKASMQAVAAASAALKKEHAESAVLRAGAVFHSAAIRSQAQREIDLIGGVSLVGIIVLVAGAFRSFRALSLGLLSIGTGIATGLLTTILLFGRIHLLTLVFGASLLGEAIDYSIQYFSVRLGAGEDWEPHRGLRQVSPRLAVALLTSVLGYGALMLTPFPVLTQIGVFAISGLLASFATVVMVFPFALAEGQRSIPVRLVRLSGRIMEAYGKRTSPPAVMAILTLLLVVSAIGMNRLTSNDDIRVLVSLSPALVQEEKRVRELAGVSGASQFLLVEGTTVQDVLEKEEDLRRRLGSAGVEIQGVSSVVPSCKNQMENKAMYIQKLAEIKTIMSNAGFTDSAIRDAEASGAQDDCLMIDAWLNSPLSRPLAHLWVGKTPSGYASIALPSGAMKLGELDQVISAIPGVRLVDKPGAISALMGKFRNLAVWALIGAVALVYLVLAARYGLANGGIILLPTVLSLLVAASLPGYFAVPITLFHVLACLLVVGVGVNYAIFLVEGANQKDATTLGVLLSVLTTLLSFGLLSFSSMPAAQHFGVTLAVGLLGVALLSPIAVVLKER